jgi:hypothetical protein
VNPVTPEQEQALGPFLAGARPDARGEVYIFCPFHPDSRRSASLNVNKGVWFCHAGCGGGSVAHLVASQDSWVAPPVGEFARRSPSAPVLSREVTMRNVVDWHKRLRRDRQARRWLWKEKGLKDVTIRKAMLGYDGRRYKIPVFSPSRRLWNVRTYDPNAPEDRGKIWNTRGMGTPRLYPIGVLLDVRVGESVMVLEGEWDTLLTLQEGQRAVTHTDGAGKPWREAWTDWFIGLNVYLCHDADEAGRKSDLTAAQALFEVATLWQCHLPYPLKESGGKDISDLLLSKLPINRGRAIRKLLDSSTERVM